MHEQLSLAERRSIAGLASLLYLTLTGYKAAVPQFAVSTTRGWLVVITHGFTTMCTPAQAAYFDAISWFILADFSGFDLLDYAVRDLHPCFPQPQCPEGPAPAYTG